MFCRSWKWNSHSSDYAFQKWRWVAVGNQEWHIFRTGEGWESATMSGKRILVVSEDEFPHFIFTLFPFLISWRAFEIECLGKCFPSFRNFTAVFPLRGVRLRCRTIERFIAKEWLFPVSRIARLLWKPSRLPRNRSRGKLSRNIVLEVRNELQVHCPIQFLRLLGCHACARRGRHWPEQKTYCLGFYRQTLRGSRRAVSVPSEILKILTGISPPRAQNQVKNNLFGSNKLKTTCLGVSKQVVFNLFEPNKLFLSCLGKSQTSCF